MISGGELHQPLIAKVGTKVGMGTRRARPSGNIIDRALRCRPVLRR